MIYQKLILTYYFRSLREKKSRVLRQYTRLKKLLGICGRVYSMVQRITES